MNNRCAVFVSSCDKYSDLWYPFFSILKNRWKEIPYPIYLSTETKSFSCDGMVITVLNNEYSLQTGKQIPWGKLNKEALKKLDTEYVLFMIDDFFLIEDVDQKRINDCINWMEKDREIAVFSFWRVRTGSIRDNKYPHFELREKKGEYRFNCQAAIWRRERLIEFIREHESPWDWEIYGSIRSRRYNDKFYSAIEGEPYIMRYFPGGALRRGKWVREAADLLSTNNIKVDFSKRGFYNPETDDVIPGMNDYNETANLILKLSKWIKAKKQMIKSLM